jgi:hypothetical protein
VVSVILRDTIDDLDVLVAELTELRQVLSHAELRGNPVNALWDAEAGLRHAAERSAARAATVRRAIELLTDQRRIA